MALAAKVGRSNTAKALLYERVGSTILRVLDWILSISFVKYPGMLYVEIRHRIDRKQFVSLTGLSTTHAFLNLFYFAHHLYNVIDSK